MTRKVKALERVLIGQGAILREQRAIDGTRPAPGATGESRQARNVAGAPERERNGSVAARRLALGCDAIVRRLRSNCRRCGWACPDFVGIAVGRKSLADAAATTRLIARVFVVGGFQSANPPGALPAAPNCNGPLDCKMVCARENSHCPAGLRQCASRDVVR
jgi:hypothetical protein